MLDAIVVSIPLAMFGVFLLHFGVAFAQENVVGRPRAGVAITEQDTTRAQEQTERTLTDPKMLSEKVRAVLGITEIEPTGLEPKALPPKPYNGKSHPFTTKNASGDGGMSPVDLFPWRAAGKMFVKFGPSTF